MPVLSSESTETRAYRSPLRDEQAAESRSRFLDAATTLFADSGYSGTSLAKIADIAGVSVESVKASGAKRDLLLTSFERSFAGIEGVELLANYEPVAEITADRDNVRYLVGIVHFIAESNKRSSRLWTALLSGAVSDAALRTQLDALQIRCRAEMLVLVDELRDRGIAATTASRESQAYEILFILSPEGYNQLVHDSGWAHEEYEVWLARAVRRLAAA